MLNHQCWFSPYHLSPPSYYRISTFPHFLQHHCHRADQGRCPAAQAGWMSSVRSTRLANNLSAPVGYEASMSTTGPVFRRPAIEIREVGCSSSSTDRRGREVEERRTKGSKGESLVFFGVSQGRNIAQTVFCNSHGHLGLMQGAQVACHSALPLAQRHKAA